MSFTETTFGPKTYLALKKSIPLAEVSNKQMYEDAGQKLGAYMHSHNLTPNGPWSVIYFNWDMEKNTTDIAIAFPIDNLDHVDDSEFSIVTLPETKAILHVLEGSYEGLQDAHMSTAAELTKRGHTYSSDAVAVEEYIVGSMDDGDQKNWRTNVYHLYK
jgi:effector-binding domain-containing protein